MYITITFSHDRKKGKRIHSYLVHGETAEQASEAITQLLLEVYSTHGQSVTATTQQHKKQLKRKGDILGVRLADRTLIQG